MMKIASFLFCDQALNLPSFFIIYCIIIIIVIIVVIIILVYSAINCFLQSPSPPIVVIIIIIIIVIIIQIIYFSELKQEPITWSMQLPYNRVTAFSQTCLFFYQIFDKFRLLRDPCLLITSFAYLIIKLSAIKSPEVLSMNKKK